MTPLVEINAPADLIARACQGEEGAREALYKALAPATLGLIRRLVGSRNTAEDLFQDTMLTFYERLESFRNEAPIGAWLRQIAVSKCLMHLRSPWRRIQRRLEPLDTDSSAWELPQLVVTDPPVESLDIERALASLSPTARAVLWCHEVEGYSHEEIACTFGRTPSFSKSQLARAHRRLRAWFAVVTAGLTVIVIGTALWARLSAPPTAAVNLESPETLSFEQFDPRVLAQAETSERWLTQLPAEPAVSRVGTRLAVATLEERIAWVDDVLSAERLEAVNPAQIVALQYERARLINSLAQVRYAENLAAGLP